MQKREKKEESLVKLGAKQVLREHLRLSPPLSLSLALIYLHARKDIQRVLSRSARLFVSFFGEKRPKRRVSRSLMWW